MSTSENRLFFEAHIITCPPPKNRLTEAVKEKRLPPLISSINGGRHFFYPTLRPFFEISSKTFFVVVGANEASENQKSKGVEILVCQVLLAYVQ